MTSSPGVEHTFEKVGFSEEVTDRLKCRSCGDVVDPRRVELGYDYCLKEECQQRNLKRVTLASVGVNKAADYYTTADELVPPRPPMPLPASDAADPEPALTPETDTKPAAPQPSSGPAMRRPTTIERLRQAEARLDRELRGVYERFQRAEITAREMQRECDDLVAGFNRLVTAENIRYRSLLRPRRPSRSPSRSTRGG
jgi:hypothetical protein